MCLFRATGPLYVPLPCYRAALCTSSVLQGRFMCLFRAAGPLYVPLPCCRAALCASSVLLCRLLQLLEGRSVHKNDAEVDSCLSSVPLLYRFWQLLADEDACLEAPRW